MSTIVTHAPAILEPLEPFQLACLCTIRIFVFLCMYSIFVAISEFLVYFDLNFPLAHQPKYVIHY